ncbi:MAG: PEP-CTERM sorting domain-containing protein [Bryobacteraceae bacterium]
MLKKTLLTLVMSAGLFSLAAPMSAAPVYTLRQFNVDDVLSAYITNSSFTNQFLLTTLFGQDQTIDFTAFTANGTNTINFVLTSDHGGWAYGFEVKKDAVVLDSGSCGTIMVIGCNNNDGATGTVYTHQTTFEIGSTVPVGDTPEPASILLTGTGFLGVFTYLKRRARKNQILAV